MARVTKYLPGVVLETDRYGDHLYAPAYCVQRSCRRANACLGNKAGPCLADGREDGVHHTRWVEALKHLKAHGKLPGWFKPPYEKEPETEESRAEDRAIKLEYLRRLFNAYRQLKAYPQSRAKMNPAVLLMLDLVDFSKIKDPNPIRPITKLEEKPVELEEKPDPELPSGPPDPPVLSQPRIRSI